MQSVNPLQVYGQLERTWDDAIAPAYTERIRIPNESPIFDRSWATHGDMEKAVELAPAWIEALNLPRKKA